MWEFVDKVVYINLDGRQDRRDIMSKFFEEGQIPLEKVIRFPAVLNISHGIVGCAQSNIGVLKMARENGWKSVLVLEDDLEWIDFSQKYQDLENVLRENPTYDVCMLAGKIFHTAGVRVGMAMHSSAYLVNNHYYSTLIDNMETGLVKKQYWLAKKQRFMLPSDKVAYNTIWAHVYNVDIYWMKLQLKDNWIHTLICQQSRNYSNINKEYIHVESGYIANLYSMYDVKKFFINGGY